MKIETSSSCPLMSNTSGFETLSDLVRDSTGIELPQTKKTLTLSRLRHRFKALTVSTLEEYCEIVMSKHGEAEKNQMISALTTNVTGFFRESHHFDILSQHIREKILTSQSRDPIRIWSAGCSRGQEPYSIAIHLTENVPELENFDHRILASDIDYSVLNAAKSGTYSSREVAQISDDRKEKYFHTKINQDGKRCLKVEKNIRSKISFKHLNLMQKWPMTKKMDAIFCRNVVIYFDASTQDRLWERFKNLLKPDGIIFVGHSERITHAGYIPLGATTYGLKTL